ncbi:MAG TPA: glycosyltransferase family 1 protein [Planctomycetota bacterium]|nr:glycosyltransferase family 1 protein [Planctomycetota bacterium]
MTGAPMRLGFDVTSAVKPHPTGTARYAVELLRACLRRLDPSDEVVLGWRLSRWRRREHAPRFDDPRVSVRPLQSPLAWATYGRLDVFHGLGVNVPRGLSARARVVTLHGIADPPTDDAERVAKVERRVAKIARMLDRANRGIVVSEFERARTAERLGVEPAKLSVVHHGIDPSDFRSDVDPAADRAAVGGALPRRPFLLYAGAITELKNVGRLLEVYARSRAKGDFDLVLLGPQRAESAAILSRVGPLGIVDRVHLAGAAAPDAVSAWMRLARALIHPSRYESFGLPILEAMACGIPVACSRAAAMPELAGSAALDFDPLSIDEMTRALDAVAADDALRAKLRARGLERARSFTWDRSAERTLAVYRACLDGR